MANRGIQLMAAVQLRASSELRVASCPRMHLLSDGGGRVPWLSCRYRLDHARVAGGTCGEPGGCSSRREQGAAAAAPEALPGVEGWSVGDPAA